MFCLPVCSSDSSSTSSDDSPARSVLSAAVPAPTSQLLSSLEKDEPRKSFGIKVQNLPVRSTGKVLYECNFLPAVERVQLTDELEWGLDFTCGVSVAHSYVMPRTKPGDCFFFLIIFLWFI